MMALEVLQAKHTDEESQTWLRILGESVERGASMVKQVLSFARGADGKRVTLQPKHLLTDLIRVLKETLPKSKATLEAFGYKTLLAADGTEAVALFVGHRGEVRAVVTDMLMPFMDGAATIRALERLDPLVKIIATSGSTEDTPRGSQGECVKAFLTKPYTAEALLRTLAQVLGTAQATT